MSIYGFFAAPSMGMKSQSAAFGSISQNLSNLNTGGYKAVDTRFSTFLASSFGSNSDIGGVKTIRKNLVSTQGRTVPTNNRLDVAIKGQGMFVLKTELNGGETFYGRDGAFQVVAAATGTTLDENGTSRAIDFGYLADKNGYFLQGWLPDASGAFDESGTLSSLRVDQFAKADDAVSTTTATLQLNLPSTAAAGSTETANASLLDSQGNNKAFQYVWTKGVAPLQWDLTIAPLDSATSFSAPPQTFTFDSNGNLPVGSSYSFSVNWADGETSSLATDISLTTQIGSTFAYQNYQKDGRIGGLLSSVNFDNSGHVVGKFTNSNERNLYKLALAIFPNFDGLNAVKGNLFTPSTTSGSVTLRAAAVDGFAQFTPFAHELSNTNVALEFTKMIMTQQAYKSSAMVFKAVDEMTRTAAQLKT